jgi:glycosyltransferase involved in cell wall biosynthesis
MSGRVIPETLGERTLFLVWGLPSQGPRSTVFARELGIRIENIIATTRRGLFVAPWKYGYQAVKTMQLLFTAKPRLVFVQSPPSLAVLVVGLYSLLANARYVVDAHSGALQSWWWTRPRWLHRLLARRALATIVTNDVFAERIRRWGATALVVRDIPTTFTEGDSVTTQGRFAILVVNSFAPDEPVTEIIEAARELEDVEFLVTGDLERADACLVAMAPANVRFTGFMADPTYYGTMVSSQAVMCLTTRDNTMQRGACEALSLGRPIITSEWPLLKDYFSQGTVHVGATSRSIVGGVRRMREDYERYSAEIADLRSAQQAEWLAASLELARLIDPGSSLGDGG